jgi:hypothetical protein
MITGTNQSKNIVSPYGARKAGVYLWGDIEATWGDALATWGGLPLVPTNQSKSTVPTYLELQNSTTFLLQNGLTLDLQGGGGAMLVTNQLKS